MDRHEIAVKAAEERWNPTIPRATHSGILIIAGQEIACDVLEDGRRVLRKSAIYRAMGKARPSSVDIRRAEEAKLPVFMCANNLSPYLQQDIASACDIIKYKGINGKKIEGYEAHVLPEACKLYVKADDEGILQDQQKNIAKACRIMLYGLATVGIISLIDDATNFVEVRERNELQKILSKYISEELMPWVKKFPNEFFKQVYKLYGWKYLSTKNTHPQCVSGFIIRYIYDKLPNGVHEELKKKNPQNENGVRSHRHHQFLTEDIGNENLKLQINQVITLMKVSNNIEDFKNLIEKM